MEYGQFAKQVVDYQKMSFENWYKAVSMLQDQTTAVMDTWLNQSTWLPEDGRQAIQSWMQVCANEGGRFKAYVDESFAGLEKYIDDTKTIMVKKTKKQASQQGG